MRGLTKALTGENEYGTSYRPFPIKRAGGGEVDYFQDPMGAPSAPVTAMASTMAGKDNKVSIMRPTNSSSQPPMYPAQIPMGTPKHTAIETAKQLAYKAARAPYNNRLKISRPKSSVPSQFNFDGAANVLLRCCSVGECGAIHSAVSETNSKVKRNTKLSAARLSRCSH